LPPADWLSWLLHRSKPEAARAETALRRLSVARSGRLGLGRMLRRVLPQGFAYLNLGHANLTPRSLAAIKAGGASVRAVLLHDVLPLDYPQFARQGTVARFQRKLQAVSQEADLVIHSAEATRLLNEAQLARSGRVPEGLVASLGMARPAALPEPSVPPFTPERRYFVMLGTIEPRKNHAFLLKIWRKMLNELPQDAVPGLVILGRRGWENEAVFAALDDLGPLTPFIREIGGADDAQVRALMAGSEGLLFPSFAEGFGLPPLEAAALGLPVYLPPLPIYRETLGDYPVYLELDDDYSWIKALTGPRAMPAEPPVLPQWEAHFAIVEAGLRQAGWGAQVGDKTLNARGALA